MTLYRGPGGTGSATSDADTTLYQDFLNQTIAARDAALQAEINAELAETNAETAETNAETAETNAETAATNAASSASAAASSASSASTSASNASTSASAAATSATAAASSASSASSSASAASISASNAATSETNAASSASSASTSATNAANSASTATTQATNAASSATAAASSASSASTSATNAANSASAASTSATNAANSATAAAASASEAAGYAASINPADLVHISGTETITGAKTFSQTITGSITGNAGTVTNGVYTTGDQTIAGTKTFSSNPILSAGTANGVAYLNGSKVLTTGSALTFDGTNLSLLPSGYSSFGASGSEGMRLTSTGLGIGTSSPDQALVVNKASGSTYLKVSGANNVNNDLALHFTDGTNNAYFGMMRGTSGGIAGALHSYTGGAIRSTLDSSGNLGLGVTPSAWGSNYKAIESQGNSAFAIAAANVNGVNIVSNAYATNAGWFYKTTGPASYYNPGAVGVHQWFTAPSGTAGNAISFTQAMTLDSSGNLGIGTTAPARRVDVWGTSNQSVRVWTQLGSIGNYAELALVAYNNFSGASNAYIRAVSTASGNSGTALTFATEDNGFGGATERARIDSSGNLLVGNTGNLLSARMDVLTTTNGTNASFRMDRNANVDNVAFFHGWASGGNAAVQCRFYNSSFVGVGSITSTGTATAYSTSSDYRLKENIAPMTGALAKVAALKPCTYKWKADGSDGEGFIAHELQEVCPDAVTGEKDAVDAEGNPQYQGIDTSFLVATLTAAIQELKAEFDAYKATHP